ncbi:MAG: cupredoxin domain-containing protein [Chloroflexi bacterium]|nr:cupredoxin domain-containing protein [Chloroflexota bacterium]
MHVLLSTAGAAVAAVLGTWRTLGWRRGPAQAALRPEGYQEATIAICGRYRPGTIRVWRDVPVRLRFVRNEDEPCSERVVFSAFGVDRRLPAFQETVVEFVPTVPGTYLFTCQRGMYRGKLVVAASGGRSRTDRRLALGEDAKGARPVMEATSNPPVHERGQGCHR